MLFGELKIHQITIITKMKWSLQMLWCLEQWVQGNKIECKETDKLRALMYIKDNALTAIAYDVYNGICNTPVPVDKKKKEKVVGAYQHEWEEFWSTWPRMRTVEQLGTKGICRKDFKGNEALCRAKYTAAVESGTITAEQMNHAAKSYIANGIADSIRSGRNELEFRSGLDPWMNQKKYLNWKDIPLPGVYKEPTIYTEA